jgi:hypothetical protein
LTLATFTGFVHCYELYIIKGEAGVNCPLLRHQLIYIVMSLFISIISMIIPRPHSLFTKHPPWNARIGTPQTLESGCQSSDSGSFLVAVATLVGVSFCPMSADEHK